MSNSAAIHVIINGELLDRIEELCDKGNMSKSEIVRRTLGYGIHEMEMAINRLTNGEFIPRNFPQEKGI